MMTWNRTWEDAILDREESQADECTTCPYRKKECKSQCMRIEEVYNPFLSGIMQGGQSHEEKNN